MQSAEPNFDPQEQITQDEMWRREVASRLSNYRARRRSKSDGDTSLHLDFEAAEAETKQSGTADTDFYRRANATFESTFEPAFDIPLAHATPIGEMAATPRRESDWLYTGHPGDVRSTIIADDLHPEISADALNDPDFDFNHARVSEAAEESARPESNVIVFPKPVYQPPPPEPVYELGEPMIERPRIVEVAEQAAPTIYGPLFADIRLEEVDAPDEPQPPAPEFDIPLQVAMIPVRVYAGLVDTLFVVIASAIFGAIIWQMIPELPHTKATFAAAIFIPALFWCVYQYLLLVYAGTTAGMHLAGIRLSTFDGKMPDFYERRSRALSMVLSCMSVGLGFAWAAVDQDMLCWHDRISRTYVTQRR